MANGPPVGWVLDRLRTTFSSLKMNILTRLGADRDGCSAALSGRQAPTSGRAKQLRAGRAVSVVSPVGGQSLAPPQGCSTLYTTELIG
jgi:hypothetical protein